MSRADVLQGLLEGCQRNNQADFERLYQMTAPALFSVCVYILRRHDLAEEALQEAFVQIWREAGKFDSRRAAPMTWMSAITRYRALDLLRKRPQEVALHDRIDPEQWADPDPGPMEAMQRQSDDQALRRCLEQVSERQREAIALAFFRGLTHQQVSDFLSASLGTVKSWIRRGMERLRECLQQ